MNYFDFILNDDSLSTDDKVEIINRFYSNYNKKLQNDLDSFLLRRRLGAALEISSAAIPFSKVGKVGASLGEKFLKQAIGKKLAQEIGAGALSGAAGGALFGTGRSFLDDEPLFKSIISDTLAGLALGGSLGTLGGKVQKTLTGNTLKSTLQENIPEEKVKALRNMAKTYYNDYIKGTSINRSDIGRIKFGNTGINELVSKGFHNIGVLPDLKNQIKYGDKLPNPRYDYIRNDINQFHIIKNQLNDKKLEYQIAEDQNGKKFYFAKDVTKKQSLPPTYWNQNPGSEINSNNIIPNSSKDFNPAQLAIPPIVLSQLDLLKDDSAALFNLGVELNVDADGNEIPDSEVLFTREQIANMSSHEFEENEKHIFEPLKTVGIPAEKDIPENKPSKSHKNFSAGTPEGKRWVTINGNHVLIDK